jgi:carboxyl-terminal processing protease
MSDTYEPPARRRPLPPFLLLLLAFAVGVFAERAGWIPGRANHQPAGLDKTFAPFWEAWDKVHRFFVDRSKVDDKRMTQGAIAGMLASLGDAGHTAYLTKENRERLKEGLEGSLQGIGARVSLRDNRPTILQTMPRSPARKAGLKPGDVLVEVDDKPVGGQSLRQIVDRVRGPAGSEVKLKIRRPGQAKLIDLTVKRAKVEVPEVAWQVLPGEPRLAQLAILNFGKQTHAQLVKALDDLRARGVKGILLDVRGNPGGLKEQAIAVTGEFLKKGQVVFIQEDAEGKQEMIKAKADGKVADIPLVVLINGGTASSSEILAGALQDHKRAKLVGTRTFGTGTVLREYPLSDGSAVLLAVYKWLTPDGREIWHHGIPPDKGLNVPLPAGVNPHLPDNEVKLTAAEFAKLPDVQLRKASEVLTKELR